MRRITAFGTAAATLLFVVGLSAQAPNLSGTWVRADDPAAAGGGGGGGRRGGGRGGGGGMGGFTCGMECTITQDAKMLTLTRTMGGGEQKMTFMLDGSPSKNSVTMGRGGEGQTIEVVSMAKVDGTRIVISTTRDFQGQSFTSTQTLSVEGGNLVVESSSGREGATPTKITYKKKG
jgi:hypothetical protein